MSSQTKPITLYSHKNGPNPWRVAIILEELGLPYESKFLSMPDGVKGKEYTAINPNGRYVYIYAPIHIPQKAQAQLEYPLSSYHSTVIQTFTFTMAGQHHHFHLHYPYLHFFFLLLIPKLSVPAIQDPNTGMQLWESGAILEYLVDTYDKEGKLSYKDGPEKYFAKQWLFFQASGQGPYFGQAAWYAFLSLLPLSPHPNILSPS